MASSSDLNVIKAIPGDHARAILLFLCKDERVCSKAAAYARELERVTSRKRKAESSIAICVRCGKTFDPDDDNNARACRRHNGDLEVDEKSRLWADHDEDCHGPIDSEEMQEDYPDGFIWSCCDKLGSEEGCKLGRHEEFAKRRSFNHPNEGYESESEAEAEGEESVDV